MTFIDVANNREGEGKLHWHHHRWRVTIVFRIVEVIRYRPQLKMEVWKKAATNSFSISEFMSRISTHLKSSSSETRANFLPPLITHLWCFVLIHLSPKGWGRCQLSMLPRPSTGIWCPSTVPSYVAPRPCHMYPDCSCNSLHYLVLRSQRSPGWLKLFAVKPLTIW